MSTATQTFGEIAFAGKDIGLPGVKYDRIATGDRGELLFVSLVCETQVFKAIRSILNGGAKATIVANGGRVRKPSAPSYQSARNPGNLYPTAEGYNAYSQKLDYGQCHAMFVTRLPGFMKIVSPEALWQELNDTRFTTPILREWLPYIEEQLRADELLDDANVFNVACGVLTAHTANLDAIVTRGLKSGKITIPRDESAIVAPPAPEPEPEPPAYLFEKGELVKLRDGGQGVFQGYVGEPGDGIADVLHYGQDENGKNIGIRHQFPAAGLTPVNPREVTPWSTTGLPPEGNGKEFKEGDRVRWFEKGQAKEGTVTDDADSSHEKVRIHEDVLIVAGRTPIAKIVYIPNVAGKIKVIGRAAPVVEPAGGPKSWKVACKILGEDGPQYNACRYKLKADAEAAGSGLFGRWTMMKGYEIEPSDDEPNY